MKIVTRGLRAAVLAALTAASAGCGFDLGFRDKTLPPLEATVTENGISIFEGIAIGVTVLDGGDPIRDSDHIEFRPQDPILGFEATTEATDFVVFGISPGKTTVRVFVNGDEYDAIAAEVRAQ